MQDKRPYNEQFQRHGSWKTYWKNGKLHHKVNYINGMMYGHFENYWPDEKPIQKKYYAR